MDKQREIRKLLAKNKEMTLDQIGEQVPFGYYCNGSKHLGAILSRMVKSRQVIRIKPGVFRINPDYQGPKRPGGPKPNQYQLF